MAASMSGISDILPEHFCWRGQWVVQTVAALAYYIPRRPSKCDVADPGPEGAGPFIRGSPLVTSYMAQKLI